MVRFLSIDISCVRTVGTCWIFVRVPIDMGVNTTIISYGTCWIFVRAPIDMGVNTTIISYGFDAALPTSHATGVTLRNRHDPLSSQHTLQTSPFRLSTTTTLPLGVSVAAKAAEPKHL